MSFKRTLLNATCLSGALVLAVAGPALADCSVETPAAGQTTVCDGPLTRSYDFQNDEFTVVVNGAQSLDASVAVYRARGAEVNVQVSAGASVTNTGAGKVFELGAGAGFDNAGTLTATHTVVSMSDAADFSNTGTITSDTRGAAAAVVIGDASLAFVNSGTIRNSGVGVQIGRDAGGFTNSGLIESTGGDQSFLHAVSIASQVEGTKVVNTGTIRAVSWSGHGVVFGGSALLENRGEILVSGLGGNGVQGAQESVVTNSGTIRSVEGSAVALGDDSSLVNTGALVSDMGAAVLLGARSTFENSGEVSAGTNGVYMAPNGTLVNNAGASIRGGSNGGEVGAVVMEGGANTLTNAGTIDADLKPGRSVVMLSSTLGQTSRLSNQAGGVIGNAEDAAQVNAVATTIGSGSILVENLGTLYGSIELSGAQGATVFNGLSLQTSSPDAPSAALLQGDVRFGAGADSLRNNGLLRGDVQFGAGADLAINYQGARITGSLDFGDGHDTFVHAGLVDGDVLMGDGDDELFVKGVIGGAIDLGDGDDVLELAASGLFSGDQVVNGGAGSDTLGLTGVMAYDGAQFAGFERLQKDGDGDATLTGHWRFDEGMLVKRGVLTLDVGASLAGGLMTVRGAYDIHGLHDGDVRVEEGGQLFGYGRIGAGGASPGRTLTNAGLVAPGSPFGPSSASLATLIVNGDYVQTGEGRLDIELGAPDELDVLHVTGAASLNGTVRFVPLDLAVAGYEYVFLHADGGVVGQFAAVEGGLFFDYLVDYGTQGQVSVRLVAEEEPEPPLLDGLDGLTPNQAAVRDAFISPGAFSPDLALVRADLNGIGAERAPAALDSLSGEVYAALPAAAADAHRRFADGLVGRGRGFDFHEGEAAGVWAAAYGWRARVDGDSAFAGRSVDTSGFAMGADRIFAPGLRLGVAVGGSETDLKQARTRSDGEIRSLEGGVYAAVRGERAWLDAALTYGDHEVEASRVLITGVASERRAAADTSARSVRADVLGGIERPVGGLAVRPYAGLSWTSVRQDGLVERGAGDAGLKVQAESYQATVARAGVSAAGAVELPNGVELDFGGQLELDRDLAREGWSAKARLIGGGDGFRIATAAPGETGLIAGAWATARLSRGWSLYANYDFETAEDARGHAVSLGARLAW
ncbi:autotransporter domain-containing protein [Caulobacter sp. 17J65-9]|uniref:autotransporter domain-containing protein n=1 Tax=Caulobacter sp. 17J65-9 TaxID=2709382 RepID=UPI0013CAFDCB|nr:autotransporter domain-containing protein [Caulobacter sp. 17J65-9]NEX93280.1 autotransporter domain-containing protein [Caulobacter sp. 17J65-9]